MPIPVDLKSDTWQAIGALLAVIPLVLVLLQWRFQARADKAELDKAREQLDKVQNRIETRIQTIEAVTDITEQLVSQPPQKEAETLPQEEKDTTQDSTDVIKIAPIVIPSEIPEIRLVPEKMHGILDIQDIWDVSRTTLNLQFTTNAVQIRSIFRLSVGATFGGFLLIGASVARTLFSQTDDLGATAIVTGAGVLSEFVGATFLLIYRLTLEQSMGYARIMERINTMGIAVQILETLPDNPSETDLRSHTKAKLLERMVEGSFQFSSALDSKKEGKET